MAKNVFFLSTSQKPLGRMDCDIVEMFIRWSCSDFEFMALIKKLRWLPFLKLERGIRERAFVPDNITYL